MFGGGWVELATDAIGLGNRGAVAPLFFGEYRPLSSQANYTPGAKEFALRVLFAALVFLVAALFAGCEPGEPTPTPRFSETDAEAIAKQVIPGFADLPTGFELLEAAQLISNKEVRDVSVESRAIRGAIDDYRRLTGAYASYGRGSTVITVQSEVFHSANDALAYFNFIPKGYTGQEDFAAKNYAHQIAEEIGVEPDEVAVTVTRLSLSPVGRITWAGRIAVGINGRVQSLWMGCMVEGTVIGCALIVDPAASAGSDEEVGVLDAIGVMLARIADKAKGLTG